MKNQDKGETEYLFEERSNASWTKRSQHLQVAFKSEIKKQVAGMVIS